MYLIYFDENKYSKENPFFIIGGVLVPEAKVLELDRTLTQIQFNFFGSTPLITENEFHGKDMFHGKGSFKRCKLLRKQCKTQSQQLCHVEAANFFV